MIELAWLVGSIVMGWIANQRGRNGFGWFLISLAVSPLLSAVFLIAAGEPKPVPVGPPSRPPSIKALGIIAAIVITVVAIAIAIAPTQERGVSTMAKGIGR